MLQSFMDHGLRGEELVQEVGFQLYVSANPPPPSPQTPNHIIHDHTPLPQPPPNYPIHVALESYYAILLALIITAREHSFSGSDTISSLLYTTFFLLLTHPAAYARLQSEIDTATAAAAASAPLLRDAQTRALPYLQAVIREVLRLFPPLCAPPLYKEVPRGGDTLCGRALPAGTLVATGNQQWHAGRDRAFWGADADCFRPERWLEAEAEKAGTPGKGAGAERLAQMNRRVELAFGCGQFICVGRAIALVEAGKVIGEVSLLFLFSLLLLSSSQSLSFISTSSSYSASATSSSITPPITALPLTVGCSHMGIPCALTDRRENDC
ncbi:hypothetical protein VTG60DRAFT_331 [Thermothelomyces hinnuleus]